MEIKMNNKRNYSIEFLRFIFMLLICFYHFQPYLHIEIIKSAYLCVEFFFILSGFYLYKSFVENKELTSSLYTFNKIKKYFLSYSIALVLTIYVDCICNGVNLEKIFFVPLAEICMLQNVRNILWWF